MDLKKENHLNVISLNTTLLKLILSILGSSLQIMIRLKEEVI